MPDFTVPFAGACVIRQSVPLVADTGQSPGAEAAFREFFGAYLPAQIVELGTGSGVFTRWLARTLPEAQVFSWDHQALRSAESEPPNAQYHVADIWQHVATITQQLQRPGATLLLCDNGDKVREVRAFAPLLRPGDALMTHDYGPTRDYWEHHERRKVWINCEIVEDDIRETLVAHHFQPYFSACMLAAAWGSWRKEA